MSYYSHDRSMARERRRNSGISQIEKIEEATTYKVRKVTEYQYRVNERLDLYPTSCKWHDLKRNRRGTYNRGSEIAFVLQFFANLPPQERVAKPRLHREKLPVLTGPYRLQEPGNYKGWKPFWASGEKEAAMEWKPIEGSSSISGFGYDHVSHSLVVQVRDQKIMYEKVPLELVNEFEAAESKGSFYNARIRGKFDGKKLEPESETK